MIPTRMRPMGVKRNTLPYDAEVEWIQGDGASYIQLPDVLEFTFKTVSDPPRNWRMAIGVDGIERDDATSTAVTLLGFGKKSAASFLEQGNTSSLVLFFLNFAGVTRINNASYPNGAGIHELSLECTDSDETPVIKRVNQNVIDRFKLSTASSWLAPPRLFGGGARHEDGETTDVLGWLAEPTEYSKATRVSYVVFYQNGHTVLDAVPVRIRQAGYLYDRVTKQLFGNAGTGSFVLGPDK